MKLFRRPRCVPFVVGVMGLAATEGFGQTLVNGSFEQPDIVTFQVVLSGSPFLTGWTIGGITIDLADENNGFVFGRAFDGNQYVDLDGTPGPGILTQTFPTVPGAAYSVSFAYSNNYTLGAAASAMMRVFDGNTNLVGPNIVTHGTAASCNLDWTVFAGTFTATSTSAMIEFVSLSAGSNAGILIDDVAVYPLNDPPVPCPADIAPPGGNGMVNIDDLLSVINAWGPCAGSCPQSCDADIAPPTSDVEVNIDDLLVVINGWGPCP
jgi:choice-of-anchor C domain-containing protein